ncbi:hypothetical protein BH09PAT2_BH09PAT2_09160 [soil metagenome]
MLASFLQLLTDTKNVSWLSKKGLFYYSLLLFLTIWSVRYVFQQLGIGTALQENNIVIPGIYQLLIIVIFECVHFMIWYLHRYRIYGNEKIVIEYSIKTEKDSEAFYSEIKKTILRQISTNRLESIIDINFLANDIIFNSKLGTEKYIRDKSINLLIWGDTLEGTTENIPEVRFNLNFTYLHALLDSSQKKTLEKDIAIGAKRSDWSINKVNSITGITVVSSNIFEISLYILAITLLSSNKIESHLKAIVILKMVRDSLKRKRSDQKNCNIFEILTKVNQTLVNTYNNLGFYYAFEELNIDLAIDSLNQVLLIQSDNFQAHQNLALLYWQKNDSTLSRRHTNIAWKIAPGNNMTRCNWAFFRFYDRQFDAGLRAYRKIVDLETANAIQVCDFLENEFDKNPTNYGLLFAFAWMNIHFADEERGILKMREFIKKAKTKGEYSNLIKEAKMLVR